MTRPAGIVVIGNEVLSGKVSDINSTYLATELTQLGVPVGRVVIIPDEREVIAEQVRLFSETFDPVFTTGGVGPTHDDITFESIAHGFGLPLVRSPELEKIIRDYYGDKLVEPSLRMAMVPEGTELLWRAGNPFPVTRIRNVYVMPGEPTVLRKKFETIKEDFRTDPFHLRRIFSSADEGPIARLLKEVEDAFPGLTIGSYPVYSGADYSVQVTIESKVEADVEAALARLVAGFPAGSILRTE